MLDSGDFDTGDAGDLSADVTATSRVLAGGLKNGGPGTDWKKLLLWASDVIAGSPLPADARVNLVGVAQRGMAANKPHKDTLEAMITAFSGYAQGAGAPRPNFGEVFHPLSAADKAAQLAKSAQVRGNLAQSEKARWAPAEQAVGAVAGVVKTVASTAVSVGKIAIAPVKLGAAIVSGENVGRALIATAKESAGEVVKVLPVARQVISMVPGVGQAIGPVLAAAQAVAEGQPVTQVLMAAARGALPGGALAQSAFDTAVTVAKGGNVGAAVLEAARNQIPEGAARQGFDAGLALARGQSLQNVAAGAAKGIVGKAMQTIPGTTIPDVVGASIARAIPKPVLLPSGVQQVANALLASPELRSLPVSELARRTGVDVNTARRGVASVIQAVQRTGAGGAVTRAATSALAMAPAIENQLGGSSTLDGAMARMGSRAAGPAFSPNAHRLASPVRWRTMRADMISRIAGRVPAAARLGRAALSAASLGHYVRPNEATGLDAPGTGYVVDPGDTMSKIATKIVGSAARVRELIAANPQVKNPDAIFAGQRLSLPATWIKAPAQGSAAPASPAALPSVPSAAGRASIQQGSTGLDVVAWQKIIGVTADGQFGPQTKAATVAWQSAHGLAADGIVGPKTWAAAAAGVGPTLPAIRATIQQGSTGLDVVAWQKIIGVTADGQFGPQTKAATVAWQKAHGLVADGIVGPKTWAAAAGGATLPALPGMPASSPGSVYAPPGGLVQVQIMLAHWATVTKKADPSDYGTSLADVGGQVSDRYARALKSFQVTFTRTPSGVLDDETYQRLVAWNTAQLGATSASMPSVSGGTGGSVLPGIAGGGVVPGVLPTVIGTTPGIGGGLPSIGGGTLPGGVAPNLGGSGSGTVTLPGGQVVSASVSAAPTDAPKSDGGALLPLAALSLLFFL